MATTLGLFSGVVLAGGASSRMGQDKALLEIDGVPLWKRQYDLLQQLGANERWVSVNPQQHWLPLHIGRLNDSVEGKGPMAGISQSLLKARYEHIAVIAVDMPRMSSSWFKRVGGRCSDGIGVVGRHPTGAFEPLAAIYPKGLGAKMAGWITEDRLSLQEFVLDAIDDGKLRCEDIREDELPWFENWNQPGQLTP